MSIKIYKKSKDDFQYEQSTYNYYSYITGTAPVTACQTTILNENGKFVDTWSLSYFDLFNICKKYNSCIILKYMNPTNILTPYKFKKMNYTTLEKILNQSKDCDKKILSTFLKATNANIIIDKAKEKAINKSKSNGQEYSYLDIIHEEAQKEKDKERTK